jgi:uncharacterized protein YdaU (DUF1376 family)
MAAIDVMPLSTSAYIADTQHLSLPQHGAYFLILMTMWRANGWIADDDRILASICKVSVLKWRALAPVLRPLLITKAGKLSQKRLLIELERSLIFREKARENGSKGGTAKALKSKEQTLAKATISLTDSPSISLQDRQNGEVNATLSSSSSLIEDSESRKERKRESGRGTVLPSDWQPSAILIDYGKMQGLDDSEIMAAAETMRLWARANANRAVGKKADWDATFQGWLRRDADRKKSNQLRTNGAHNGRKFQDDNLSASRAAGRLAEQAERGEFAFGPRPSLLPAQSATDVRLLSKGRSP